MLKRIAAPLVTAVLVLGFSSVLLAAERVELKDEDGDGRKETQIFYEGNEIARAVIDKNGDEKPDQWLYFMNGKRHAAEIDSDFDGKIDTWIMYNVEGKAKTIAKDTHHNRRPDYFQTFLKGRELVLREYDRNFDGRIDKRALMQWDPNKKITVVTNGRVGTIPNPGYRWIWKEEDNNFDGKIDVYQERDNKNPSVDKIGKEIDPLPATAENKSGSPSSEKKQGASKSLVQIMNERYGYGSK